MKHVIHVAEKEIAYTLKQSHRARHIRLRIDYDGKVTVTAPCRMRQSFVEQFMMSKSLWIAEKLAYIKSLGHPAAQSPQRQDYARYKSIARLLAENRLQYFNAIYGLSYGRISIRNQTTRWGSCSGNGNLNFNYRIALLPPQLCDYIIVHELCHTAELNHSQKFWHLVAHTIPHYAKLRKELRQHGLGYMNS